jgi:hypothetical protein
VHCGVSRNSGYSFFVLLQKCAKEVVARTLWAIAELVILSDSCFRLFALLQSIATEAVNSAGVSCHHNWGGLAFPHAHALSRVNLSITDLFYRPPFDILLANVFQRLAWLGSHERLERTTGVAAESKFHYLVSWSRVCLSRLG